MENRFETFSMLIAKINRNIKKLKNLEMAEYGLRHPQISCLYVLYFSEGITAAELCERCEEDKATISRSLDYLEEKGYLTRNREQSKGYKSPIFPTEKGREMAKKIVERVHSVLDRVGGAMTEEDRVIFYRCLAAISDGVDRICKQFEEQGEGAE